MTRFALIAIDVIAVCLLVFALYFPRHRRRDLVPAYLGVNLGVVAVASSLSSVTSTAAGVGLGLGLFGVLSIIRLRSTELDQPEVSYYFCSLALGLLASIGDSLWQSAALMALLLVGLFAGDHSRLFSNHRRELVVLDTAIIDHNELRSHLERLLGAGARVRRLNVQRVDLVNDTTMVDVRYTGPAFRQATVNAAGELPVPVGVNQ